MLIQWLNTIKVNWEVCDRKNDACGRYNVCRANNRAVISIIENDSLGCWSYNLLLKQFFIMCFKKPDFIWDERFYSVMISDTGGWKKNPNSVNSFKKFFNPKSFLMKMDTSSILWCRMQKTDILRLRFRCSIRSSRIHFYHSTQ